MKKSSSCTARFTPCLLLLLVVLLTFLFARSSAAELLREELQVDGLTRTYYLHLPAHAESSASLPVVVALHGGGKADGDEMAEQSGFNALADREGFIVVYPNGIEAQWNDGRGKAFRGGGDNTHIDDVGFISGLIDHMIEDYQGDPNRIYVTGVSNGGMMTLRLGCEMASKLAAIAAVIANTPKNIADTCTPDAPLPILLMNGTQDPVIPWQGGDVTNFRQTYGKVLSTDATIRFWVKRNQCQLAPQSEYLPDEDQEDGSRVKVTTYSNPGGNGDVILYTIEGGGHNFPGSHTRDMPRLLGRKNGDIAGPEVIWKFFKQHRR